MARGVPPDESSLPDALLAAASEDVRYWLRDLRGAVDEYDDCPCPAPDQALSASTSSLLSDLNKYFSAEEDGFSDREAGEDVYSNAFDDILSTLGNEIYQLDAYRLDSSTTIPGEVVSDIMDMIESCKSNSVHEEETEAKGSTLKKVCSFSNISILSDEVFLKSGSSGNSNRESPRNDSVQRHSFDVNRIFDKGDGAPIPPKRKHRNSSGNNLNVDTKPRPTSMMEGLQIKISVTNDGDSDSGNNSPASDYSDYQHIWNCTSGFRCGPIAPKTRLPRHNYGTINAISLDSVKDISNSSLDISSRIIVSGRPSSRVKRSSSGVGEDRRSCVDDNYSCDGSKAVRLDAAECTADCDPSDECHRSLARARKSNSFVFTPGKRAIAERIYENVDSLRSARIKSAMEARRHFDDDTSSVEIVSDSDSWRTPIGRERNTSTSTDYASESPIYENLREYIDRPALTSDVLAWKALLLDPYWNDDEEDEWVSPEEASEYGKEQKSPFVIPKIRQYSPRKLYPEDENQIDEPTSPSIRDVCKKFEEEIINRAQHDTSKYIKSPSKLAVHNDVQERYHFQQNIETSPIVTRKSRDGQRINKSKSLITGDRKEQMKYLPRVLPLPYESKMHVIYEGNLNRTKLTENGKKVKKKSWHREYAILTETSLAFYKDKKSYESARDSPMKHSNGNPEIMELYGVIAGKATPQQTSRSTAIVITNAKSKSEYLIHHEDPEIAQHWGDALIKAINKLPSEHKCPENIYLHNPLIGTPSPTHKHVSKVKSGKVIEGSIEDLTDIPENAVVISRLKKFLNRRPTKESLIKNKIYQDELVFGRSLEQLCPPTNLRVPEFVVHCIKVIESSEENMSSDGLYRASGNLSQVQKIRVEVNQNNFSILDKEPDVNVLTGALKMFFRELKEPIIPYKLFQPSLNASANPSPEARIKEFREIIDRLPECNRQTLKYVLEHLLRVTARKEKNRMHISNIAIVLGPTLLQAPPEASQNLAIECHQQNRVIEILMSDFERIFKDDIRRKK